MLDNQMSMKAQCPMKVQYYMNNMIQQSCNTTMSSTNHVYKTIQTITENTKVQSDDRQLIRRCQI